MTKNQNKNQIVETKPKKAGPLDGVGLKKEQLLEMYRKMLFIRRFEERSAQAYGMGKIGGFCHLYIGQEAVAVGAIAAIRPDDYIFSAYRDHGHALAKGVDPRVIMAELFGKVTGCSQGRGGSMHLYDAEKNFMGGYGIVGGHVPLAAGTAFASKYRGEDRVTLCFFGEGASNQGVFYETLNLVALWKLPVIFICENNRYAMGTSLERSSAVWDIYQKAASYDMARALIDGNDVLLMYKEVSRAVKRARDSKLPTFLEARTYRYRGHSMSDPIHGHYRTKEEVEEHKRHDPITMFGNQLTQMGYLTEAMIEEYEKEFKAIIEEAVEFADKSPEPPLDSLYDNVYS